MPPPPPQQRLTSYLPSSKQVTRFKKSKRSRSSLFPSYEIEEAPSIDTDVTPHGLRYVVLPAGTLLYKGASSCYKKEERQGINPVWFGELDTAASYALNERWIDVGVGARFCVYKARRPLKLLLVTHKNIERLLDIARNVVDDSSPWLTPDYAWRDSSVLSKLTRRVFPGDYKRDPTKRVLYPMPINPFYLDFEQVVNKFVNQTRTVSEAASSFIDALFCSRRRAKTPEQVDAVEELYKQPHRRSIHDVDIDYCVAFCRTFANLSEAVGLDGYFAPRISRSPDTPGLHPEIMMCDPYRDALKLVDDVPIGVAASGALMTRPRGSIRTAKHIEKEIVARQKARSFRGLLRKVSQQLTTTGRKRRLPPLSDDDQRPSKRRASTRARS